MAEVVTQDKEAGNHLRSLRTAAGLTQQELATLVGVNQSTVGRWEAGEAEPSHSRAIKLADALNVGLTGLPFSFSSRARSVASEDGLEDKKARALAAGHEELLSERLERLESKLSEIEATGMDGQMYSQRIAGDLYRLMNTALLNCFDLLRLHERQQKQDAAKAAMEFAANAEGGQAYLQLWLAGEHDAIRQRWPDAPAK